MKSSIVKILPAVVLAAITLLTTPALRAAELSKSETAFLATYEKVRAALADDNLAAAKKAAVDLGDAGSPLALSNTLPEARAAFAVLTKTAVKYAAGQPGFYIFHCPMVNQDWVQTARETSNPFGGPEMRACGELKK